jgi:hypothetical protein
MSDEIRDTSREPSLEQSSVEAQPVQVVDLERDEAARRLQETQRRLDTDLQPLGRRTPCGQENLPPPGLAPGRWPDETRPKTSTRSKT